MARILNILTRLMVVWRYRQLYVWRYQQWRSCRALEQANVRAGGYTDGTPMSHEDQVVYGWLTRASIGGLALILVGVTILVTLGAVGK